MVGAALKEAQIGFHVLHCGPSPVPINVESSGVYNGITFEYTSAVRRPENTLARLAVYLSGVLTLTKRLFQLRRVHTRTVVYLYVMDGPLNPYVGLLCRLLGLPIVQELCEWLPGEPTCPAFTRWLHRKLMFRLASGVLVISRAIEARVQQRCERINPRMFVHRVPTLVDLKRFDLQADSCHRRVPATPSFVYCGTWLRDIFFIIRAFRLVRQSGIPCQLRIVGVIERARQVLDYAREQGLGPGDIVLLGYIDDPTLIQCYRTAAALLLPLPNDDRSRTRMPNKLGDYLAAGRPVVTSGIGDLTDFLTDGVSAYLTEPGSEADFAEKTIAALRDPDLATRIGRAGRQACLANLDYRAHVPGLASFFLDCAPSRTNLRSPSGTKRPVHPGYRLVRNLGCTALAATLMASGQVRRARRRTRSNGVATAIYFHSPNSRLFARCIRWLFRNGYKFVSGTEVVEMLREGRKLPPGAVWLSFDDGFDDTLRSAVPLLRARRIPATFFLPTGILDGDGLFPWLTRNGSRRNGTQGRLDRHAMTVSNVKELAAIEGLSLGSHTVSHAVIPGLKEAEIREELQNSKRALESWTQKRVDCFAYPEGRFKAQGREQAPLSAALESGAEERILAECGYLMAATTQNEFITADTDPYLVPRLNVPDEVWFPEAICQMMGVWRPAVDPLIGFLRNVRRAAATLAARPVPGTPESVALDRHIQ